MDVDNPLSQQFLLNYPVEAARVLEQLATEDVAALFEEISPQVAASVASMMLPNYSAVCVGLMEMPRAAKLLNTMSVTHAARIFTLLGQDKRKELLAMLGIKHRKRIRRVLNYKSLSAGDLMNPNVDLLPQNLTVADAVRRIGRHRHLVKCEIYVVDDENRFVGVVDLGKLVITRKQARLKEIMNRSLRTVSVHASTESLLGSSAWVGRQRLPVVESDNTLVGILDYSKLKETLGSDDSYSRDPMESMFSLAGLYWLSLVHLLDSLLNIAAVRKGEEQ